MKLWRKTALAGGLLLLSLLAGGCTDEGAQEMSAYRKLGINCLNEGRYEEAASAFQKALDAKVGDIGETEIDICYYKAQALYMSGDPKGALAVYTALIEYNGAAEAYYLRGCLYYSDGIEAAEGQGAKDFDEAIRRESDDYDLYIRIYETLMAAGNPQDNAEGYLLSALDIKGETAKDQMEKGRIYYLLENYTDARTALEAAAKDGETEAYFYLTNVYEQTGDTGAAEQAFEQYLDSGADAAGLCEIARTMLAAGQYERAVTCCEKALSMETTDALRQELCRLQIKAYEYEGDFASAKALMSAYTEAYPKDTSMEEEAVFLETR